MNKPDNLNLGDEIKNVVQNALNNKDFNELNRNVKNVVKDALDEARKSVDWKSGSQNNWSNKSWNDKSWNDKSWDKKSVNYNQSRYEKESSKFRELKTNKPVYNNSTLSIKPSNYTVPVGQVTGTALTVLGVVGTVAFGIGLSVLTILGLTVGTFFHTVSLFLLPLFLFSLFVLISGNNIRKRLKRFQKYLIGMKDRDYSLINDLSSFTGLNNKYIQKDLQNMIKVGMFPEGNLDDKKTTFMITNERYNQYLDLKKNMELKSADKVEMLNAKDKDGLDPEIRKAIAEGREFIIEIKQANIAIPGEEISRKLDRLEILVRKIFDHVEIHPEKFVQIKKFTEYFLPTTFKLVDAYKKLDYQSVQGENISNAKAEIEETMDTINLAFENLLDDLFHDMSMDISTDISVLETMFAQEGLTDNSMRVKNNTNMEDKK